MSEIDRFNRDSDWIDLEFVERERTPEQIVEVGIQLHLAGLSLSNTKQYLEKLGVQRSRTAIHNWVQKADLQPTGTRSSNYVALDETVIQLGTEDYWLYAAVDPNTTEFLHVKLFPTTNSGLTLLFLREPREIQHQQSGVSRRRRRSPPSGTLTTRTSILHPSSRKSEQRRTCLS